MATNFGSLATDAPIDVEDTTAQNRWDEANGESGTLTTSAQEITGSRILAPSGGGSLLIFGSVEFRCAKATTVGDIYEAGISIDGTSAALFHQSTRSLSDDPDSPDHNSGQAQGVALVEGVPNATPIYLTARNATGARGRWGANSTIQIMQIGGSETLDDQLSNAVLSMARFNRMPDDASARGAFQSASATLTLSGTYQRPTGCYYVTPHAGEWLAIGAFDYNIDGQSDRWAAGYIGVDGSPITSLPAIAQAEVASANVSEYGNARVTCLAAALTGSIAGGSTIDLRANQGGSYGDDATVQSSFTKLAVVQVG